MANIKKSFNFRNGVQVDDDNLKVSATGLVGIGTTVPTEALDVRGNLIVTGVSSAATAQAGVLTVTTLNPSEIIGAGVSIVSGIVTASSGIITFYGDARFLQGMPTSQWEDVNTGLGVTSIYNTGGNVGIATSNPQFTLQIGGNVNSFKDGVGISSFGDIKVSGAITATSFTGDIAGDVTGNVTGLINSSGISTFGGINATGRIVGAATSNVIPFLYANQGELPSASTYHGAVAHVHATGALYFAHAGAWWELVNKESSGVVGTGTETYNIKELDTDQLVSTSTTTTSLNVAGITTVTGIIASASVFLNSNLDVDGHTNLDNVSIAGVTTFTGAINADGGASVDNIQIGVTGDNEIDTSTGNLTIDSSGGTTTIDDNLSITGETNAVNVVASGVITATTELNSPLIGVGTDTPANDVQIQVRKESGDAGIQITSDNNLATLKIGRDSDNSNANVTVLQFGGGAGANYSHSNSFDIINYDTGNFNYHLSGDNASAVQGDFHWHKGINNSRLMTLTGIGGSLGIGITTPSTPLHVLGNATISGNVFLGADLTMPGALNVPSVISNLTGNVTGNVNATTGLSTFSGIEISLSKYFQVGGFQANRIGIGTTSSFSKLRINEDADKRFSVSDSGNVGIKTDDVFGNSLFVNGAMMGTNVGIGTILSRAAVDFADAGQGITGVGANRMYMIPPKVGAAQTAALAGLVSGAMIYNTNLNKLQVYNGTNWETITSVEVTG